MHENITYYRNYIFDLYGTLVDIHTDERSDEFWNDFQNVLAGYGSELEAGWLREFYENSVRAMEAQARDDMPDGEPEIDLLPIFVSFLSEGGAKACPEDAVKLAESFRMLSIRKLRLFDGASELLKTLRKEGRRVYLLSNAQTIFTRPELRALELDDLFDGTLLSAEAGRKKPDPMFYRALLEKYELDPAESIMVGNDDVADCHGAAQAGLDSLYIHTEQSPEPVRPLPDNCRQIASIREVWQES